MLKVLGSVTSTSDLLYYTFLIFCLQITRTFNIMILYAAVTAVMGKLGILNKIGGIKFSEFSKFAKIKCTQKFYVLQISYGENCMILDSTV